jgi:hypothetical protein
MKPRLLTRMACGFLALLWPMWVNMSCLFVTWTAAGIVVGTYYSFTVVCILVPVVGLASCIVAGKLTPTSSVDDAILFLGPLCILMGLSLVEKAYGPNDQCVPFDAAHMFPLMMAAVAGFACGIGCLIGSICTDTELCQLLLNCLPACVGDELTVHVFQNLEWLTTMTADQVTCLSVYAGSSHGHSPARLLRRVLHYGNTLVVENALRPSSITAYRSAFRAVSDLLINVHVFFKENQEGVKAALLALVGRFPHRALGDEVIHDKLAAYFLLLCKSLTRAQLQALLHTVGSAAAVWKPHESSLLQHHSGTTIRLHRKHYMFDIVCRTRCIPLDDMFVLAIDPAFDPEQTEYRPQALAFKQRVLRWHWRAARRHWCALHSAADVRAR